MHAYDVLFPHYEVWGILQKHWGSRLEYLTPSARLSHYWCQHVGTQKAFQTQR